MSETCWKQHRLKTERQVYWMDGNHLEFVGDISSRAQQELDDIEVTIGTRQ